MLYVYLEIWCKIGHLQGKLLLLPNEEILTEPATSSLYNLSCCNMPIFLSFLFPPHNITVRTRCQITAGKQEDGNIIHLPVISSIIPVI